jgi:cell division protein FtsB
MKISLVRAGYAFIVLCGIIYAFIALRGPNGIPGLIEKRRQVHEYEAVNEQLHREIEQKEDRIHRLESDPREQEIEIRQRYKFTAPNERVYILNDKK